MKNLIKYIVIICIIIVVSSLTTKPKKIDKDPFRTLSKHVVPYRVLSEDNKRFATGFHLKYNKKVYIVTNKHVCDDHIKRYGHGNIQFGSYVGKIIKNSRIEDLCLVTSNRSDGLELSDTHLTELDKVTVIGFPRGMGKVIRHGRVISQLKVRADWIYPGANVNSIRISTIAYGGNSGSPILNENGKVNGVLFAGNGYHTEALIVPLVSLKVFLIVNAI